MKTIPITGNETAIIDDGMAEIINQWQWRVHKSGKLKYVCRETRNKGIKERIFLHHVIIGRPLGKLQVDHINRNPLDNRLENLRIVTRRQNAMNAFHKNKSSKFIGVCWDKRKSKWLAQIKKAGKCFLGYFSNEVDAAKAYQDALAGLNGN